MRSTTARWHRLAIGAALLCAACSCGGAPATEQGQEGRPPPSQAIADAAIVRSGPGLVVLTAQGSSEADLGGWILVDADGHELRLPPSTKIGAGKLLEVRVGAGTSDGGTLYLTTDSPFDTRREIVLADAFGGEVDRFDPERDR